MEAKLFTYRKMTNADKEKFSPYHFGVMIELDSCPFCGFMGVLNHTTTGWFGWCSVCDSQGPHHPDWQKAAEMWNGRNIRIVANDLQLDPVELRNILKRRKAANQKEET